MVELPEVQPEVQEEQVPSPRLQPGGAFSSDDDVSSDDEDVIPIQSQANIDLVTFDSLNSHSVQKLIQERDRLELGGLRRRHTLLRQIDRTQWSVLFQF